jgi:tetratricopeptide (TPR) repeat protein
MREWKPFPHDNTPFIFDDDGLSQNWPALHRGDLVPFPDTAWVQEQLKIEPRVGPENFSGDLGKLASDIRAAWRCYHAGEFRQAVEQADTCGILAHACANKATGIHASYLQEERQQQDSFLNAIEKGEAAISFLPDDPNSHYFRAFNLGRYGQSISIVEALKRGMAGKIHESLSATLALAPDHAEAHTALGMYHAEIINKVGKMIGGMTYGASTGKAIEHFETALELTPEAPIAHIEFGNGLYLLFGDKRLDEVTDLYIRASEMQAQDAMEKLDIESALAELE